MSTNMQNNPPYANIMSNYETNQPSFMNNSNLNIGTLNCRSLCKSSSPETGADFIRYLRSLHLDILCVQEAQAIGTVQEQLTLQLQASSTLWTPHCGIISFNPLLTLQSIDVELDDRLLVCQVSHVNALFPPITLVNLYAPAAYSPRVKFFRELLALPLFNFNHLHSRHSMNSLNQPADIDPTAITPMLILGDFNYHATAYIQDDENYATNLPRSTDSGASVHRTFHHLLNSYFFECTHSREEGPMLPTFRRGSSQSTIDYLYASPFLYQHLHSSDIVFLSSDWTDHALLRSRFVFSSDRQGPGLWRANPSLVTNPYFTDTLYTELDRFFNDLSLTNDIDMAASLPTSSPQDNWDSLKSLVKRVAFRVSRHKSNALTRLHKRLQRKRNRILRTHSNPSTRELLLQPVERQIGAIQAETTQNQRLRAGQRWREQGETSAGYLKRTIHARAIKRSIDGLLDPTTNLLCTSPSSMQGAAFGFYEQLYSTNPVDTDSIDLLCNFIPESDTLQASDHSVLLCPFTIDDLLRGTHRTSPLSSPGVDGIPYPILNLLFQHHAAAQLALRVFNDALTYGIFPSSWLKTCMCLLPKKGDLRDLKNWRPLSMICCDAKIFTRLLNHRLMPFMNRLICPQQSGFMPGRFIGDNGMILQSTKLIATHQSSEHIALLLDQEKAYDRIHPAYLRAVMQRFNIPTTIIHSLLTLLFSTEIHININGHVSQQHIFQHRGIRQGDPISPLLFNIAFDPFLRSIHQNPQFQGFNFATESPLSSTPQSSEDLADSLHQLFPNSPDTTTDLPTEPPLQTVSSPPPTAVKILAYADDTLVFLRGAADFRLLQQAITVYMNASNALLNYHKTIATALSGKPSTTWQTLLHSHGITAWHDRTSSSPLTYLGYPICSSITQRNIAFQKLYDSIRNDTHLHSQRNLSIRGRVTVLNSLIYSKLWHALRLSIFTKTQLLSLRGLGTAFINTRIFPRLSFDTLSQPRSSGGVGLLDPLKQQQALQWYWVCPLLLHYLRSPLLAKYTVPSLPVLMYTLSWFYSSTIFSHFLYYLFFPSSRNSFWFPQRPLPQLSYLNPLLNIQSCISAFSPHVMFDSCYVDAPTCLTLPFRDILLQSVPTDHPSFPSFRHPDLVLQRYPTAKRLLVSDVFYFDSEFQVLCVRSSFHQCCHPNIARTVARFVRHQQLCFKPFFIQQCTLTPRPTLVDNLPSSLRPFCLRFLLPSSPSPQRSLGLPFRSRGRLPLNSIRYFKKIISLSLPSPANPSLPPHQWRSFWSASIPTSARTVWYRAIHQKIPTRSLLHTLIPQDHPSPDCTICSSSSTETISHFLFSCPPKFLVWREMFQTYIHPSPLSDANLLHSLQKLLICSPPPQDRDTSLPLTDLSFHQLFAVTLVTIWQAHWRWIFDRTPFLSTSVTHRLTRSLNRLDAELNLDS